ncbi:MAG: hypothetical protein ACRDNW_16455 [Trebonia sp.]
MTGTLTGSPPAEPAGPAVKTRDPLESPAPTGTRADRCTTAEAPGARTSFDGDTVPNGSARDTEARSRTAAAVPPAAAVPLEITAVQVPAAGCSTCAVPYPLAPCGSECAASFPDGSTRMTRTRAFWSFDEGLRAGQEIDAFSSAAPRGTANFTVP